LKGLQETNHSTKPYTEQSQECTQQTLTNTSSMLSILALTNKWHAFPATFHSLPAILHIVSLNRDLVLARMASSRAVLTSVSRNNDFVSRRLEQGKCYSTQGKRTNELHSCEVRWSSCDSEI